MCAQKHPTIFEVWKTKNLSPLCRGVMQPNAGMLALFNSWDDSILRFWLKEGAVAVHGVDGAKQTYPLKHPDMIAMKYVGKISRTWLRYMPLKSFPLPVPRALLELATYLQGVRASTCAHSIPHRFHF